MQQGLMTAGALAGGLGLFLLAVGMITDGLKQSAGGSLRDMLAKWTRSPGRGILTGISITAIVQSSSAVTVATIGFVNAGLLSMYQALGVVYGANIGTTMTGWLVALIGFKIKVDAFALPMIGIGMILRLTGGDGRRASIGTTMVGFGLFFIGIDILREAFEGMATTFNLQQIRLGGIAEVAVYVGIGVLMTILTQSSSAAIAITLTAATGGLIGLYAAAAMVIGANIGTTSTAALAVIGATPNAKRVAAAHVIFNLLTGIVALATLPVLFWAVHFTEQILHMEDIPAVTLAMFHTTFNIFGVLLMLPMSKRLAHFLEKRFITPVELEGRPQFLDNTVVSTPELAFNALVLELTRVTNVARRMALEAISSETGPGKRIDSDHAIVITLSSAVAEFITLLERGALPEEVANQLAKLLGAQQHLLAASALATEVAKAYPAMRSLKDSELSDHLYYFRSAVAQLIDMANPDSTEFSMSECEGQLDIAQQAYTDAKSALLRAGSAHRIPVPAMIDLLEHDSQIRRMARQIIKAIRLLNGLYAETRITIPDEDLEETETSIPAADNPEAA